MPDRNSKQSRASRASSLRRLSLTSQSYGYSDKIPVVILLPALPAAAASSSRGKQPPAYDSDTNKEAVSQETTLNREDDRSGEDLPIPVSPKHIAALYASHRWRPVERASPEQTAKRQERRRIRLIAAIFLLLVLVVILGIVIGVVIIKQQQRRLNESEAASSSASAASAASTATFPTSKTTLISTTSKTPTPTIPGVPAKYVYPTACGWEGHCPGSYCTSEADCDGSDICWEGQCTFCRKAGHCVNEFCNDKVAEWQCSEPWTCNMDRNKCVREFRYSNSSFPINNPSPTDG